MTDRRGVDWVPLDDLALGGLKNVSMQGIVNFDAGVSGLVVTVASKPGVAGLDRLCLCGHDQCHCRGCQEGGRGDYRLIC